jgi:HAD superfamily hydrolase (TIGR01509 family)
MLEPEVLDDKYQKLVAITDKGFKAFLYDCDGTLADNMQAHKDSYVKVAATYGIELDTSIIDELAGWPTVKVAAEISKRYAVPFDVVAFADAKSKVFFTDFMQNTKPVDFVYKHLIEHAGKVRIGVVSGGSRKTVQRTLETLGIWDKVEVLVGAGDTLHGKPAADPFLLAAEKLGVEPVSCMVFEDGEAGVMSAIAAGMQWVRVDQL